MTLPVRVAVLGPWPPPFGGVQTHLVALRDGLRDAGAEVAVFNLTRHRGEPHDWVYFPSGPGSLLAQLRTFRPAVIHVHLGGNITPRLLALLVACRVLFGPSILATIHSGGYPSSARGQALSAWSAEGFVFRQMQHVIVVNDELHALFLRIGVAKSRMSMLLPTLRLPKPASRIPEALEQFAAEAAPLIVTVGLLEDEYLIPMQLEAFSQLQRLEPDARFVIIGSGSREHQLRERVAEVGLSRYVLLNGDTPHEVTLALMLRATMLWRITAYDGDSVSVREALAMGVPVLATDTGARPAGVLLTEPRVNAIVEGALRLARGGRAPGTPSTAGPDFSKALEAHVTRVLAAARG